MIRRLIPAVTLLLSLGLAAPAQACLPYIPWLDPFAWLGFYGCGGGYANGCYNSSGAGYGPYTGGYNYAPAYAPSYAAPAYSAPMTYPTAPLGAPGCNCTGALPTQQPLAAVQVPVTTYRPVTRYVPQTTWRTQYQQPTTAYAQPTTAYAPPNVYAQANAYSAYPTTAYAAPAVPTYGTLPAQTVYNSPPVTSAPVYGGTLPQTSTAPQTFYPQSAPVVTPNYTVPGGPVGDVAGDHEFPAQSAVVPQPLPTAATRSVIPVSATHYGVKTRAVRSFNAAVR